ncbi:MAG: L-histidine N-alpha-methyltransferase [Crocinitomix sp.]|jgi:L-histidine N-alpha-methyltransferase
MISNFKKDVFEGLTATKKSLKSKYFYDDIGSRIFQEIMEMPEYYLTNCEFDIFQKQSAEIFNTIDFKTHFNLIELGAGDGLKTAELIRYLSVQNIDFTYTPIDISKEANELLCAKLKLEFPQLSIAPKTGDYFEILKDLQDNQSPSLLLFIGSNVGNYLPDKADELFQLFNRSMKIGDKLLIGVDLKKDPAIIHKAYFDPHGITKRFNLNLLTRINRELGGNFNLNNFDFYVNYESRTGEVRSYIKSLTKQVVEVEVLNLQVEFEVGEVIWTELSKKYDLDELEISLQKAGFKTIQHFTDSQQYFSDSIFEKT